MTKENQYFALRKLSLLSVFFVLASAPTSRDAGEQSRCGISDYKVQSTFPELNKLS